MQAGRAFKDFVNRAAVRLDYATVDAVWRQVRRLVKQPESFPFVYQSTQVFGGVNQLLGASSWQSRIGWNQATDHRTEATADQNQ